MTETELSKMKIDEVREYVNKLNGQVDDSLRKAQTELREICEDILQELIDEISDLPARVNNELSRFSLLKFYLGDME